MLDLPRVAFDTLHRVERRASLARKERDPDLTARREHRRRRSAKVAQERSVSLDLVALPGRRRRLRQVEYDSFPCLSFEVLGELACIDTMSDVHTTAAQPLDRVGCRRVPLEELELGLVRRGCDVGGCADAVGESAGVRKVRVTTDQYAWLRMRNLAKAEVEQRAQLAHGMEQKPSSCT